MEGTEKFAQFSTAATQAVTISWFFKAWNQRTQAARMTSLAHILRAYPSSKGFPQMPLPCLSCTRSNLIFPGSWHQGPPHWWVGCWCVGSRWWVWVHSESTWVLLLSLFLCLVHNPFKTTKRESGAHDELVLLRMFHLESRNCSVSQVERAPQGS